MSCKNLRSYSVVSTIKISIHNCVCLLSHHSTWALILYLNIRCLGAIFVNFTKHHSTLLTQVQQHLDDIGIWSVTCKKKNPQYFSLYVGYKNWSIAILHCAPKSVITVNFLSHIRRIILVSHFLWNSYLGETSARNYLHTYCLLRVSERHLFLQNKAKWT